VESGPEIWKMWTVAKSFQCRPSQIAELEGTWEAYCLDAAVSLFGNWVESKLSERSNLGYPKHDLERLLEFKTGRSHDPAGFAGMGSLMQLAEM